MNQVAIHPHQTAELFRFVPVQRDRILEPAVFQRTLVPETASVCRVP